jgi:anthranilate/para-aminobenzoate synthase component II
MAHEQCMNTDDFVRNERLTNTFDLIATTEDYVSIIENSTFGWYGTQFHPEKAQFEFGKSGKFCARLKINLPV